MQTHAFLTIKHHFKMRLQDGKTPLYTAVERGELDVARVLLQYGANPNVQAHVCIRTKEITIKRSQFIFQIFIF